MRVGDAIRHNVYTRLRADIRPVGILVVQVATGQGTVVSSRPFQASDGTDPVDVTRSRSTGDRLS